jgi:hypothetical protein
MKPVPTEATPEASQKRVSRAGQLAVRPTLITHASVICRCVYQRTQQRAYASDAADDFAHDVEKEVKSCEL